MVFRTPPGWRDVTIFTSIAPIPEHAPRLACRVTKEPRLGLDLDAHVFQALIRLARETRGIDLRETRPMAVAGRKAVLVRHLVVDREGTELEQRLVFIEAPHPSVPEVMVINVSGHSAESTAIQQASDAVLQSVQFLEPGAAGSAESMTVSGLVSGPVHFAVKAWVDGESPTLGPLSNVVEITVW